MLSGFCVFPAWLPWLFSALLYCCACCLIALMDAGVVFATTPAYVVASHVCSTPSTVRRTTGTLTSVAVAIMRMVPMLHFARRCLEILALWRALRVVVSAMASPFAGSCVGFVWIVRMLSC